MAFRMSRSCGRLSNVIFLFVISVLTPLVLLQYYLIEAIDNLRIELAVKPYDGGQNGILPVAKRGLIKDLGVTDKNGRTYDKESAALGGAIKSLEPTLLKTRGKLTNEEYVVAPRHGHYPGKNGLPFVIKRQNLSDEEKVEYDKGWSQFAFNIYASDRISLQRRISDKRDKACFDLKYADVTELPDTSVIICFINEAWSVLLRTVHSVINNSPKELVKEIILVDDYSNMNHLGAQLQEYMDKLGIVKIIRTQRREGLIRARVIGARAATGTVLTFLDSHSECTPGWLEPILDEIRRDRTRCVTPVIDAIHDDTFAYMHSHVRGIHVGGFDWQMGFAWVLPPPEEQKKRELERYVSPMKSPTMAGGLFSIERDFFFHIGAYDEGMDIWGAENVELSLRIWMCGGSLVTLPCSNVGHIFRKRAPYSKKSDGNFVKKNTLRLVEVWLDEYKQLYYEAWGIVHETKFDYGDISSRLELRDRLKCKSFHWYLKNVYPSLFIPSEAVAKGEVRNEAFKVCLDSPTDPVKSRVKLYGCHGQGGNQFWLLSKRREIRRSDKCMDYSGGEEIEMYPCHSQKGNQEWLYREDNTIQHGNTGKCLEVAKQGATLQLSLCNTSAKQKWIWHRTKEASAS